MKNNKKTLAVLSTTALTALIVAAVTSPVSAKTTAFIVKDTDAKLAQYDYKELVRSAEDKLLQLDAPLYDAYMKNTSVVALVDDVAGNVAYNAVKIAAEDAAVAHTPFDFNKFTEAAKGDSIVKITDTVTSYTVVDGKVVGTDVKPVDKLAVSSVSAITDTKLSVKLSGKIDAADKTNFSIAGMTVVSAELNENKQEVLVTISGAELAKDYTLVTQGIKVNGEVKEIASKQFRMPEANSLYTAKLTVEGNKTVIKADGSSSALVTFELTDSEGNKIKDADNAEVAFTSTFGTFAEKRVTVQNGVASALFNSEVLDSDKTALLTATVVEASNKNLFNIKAEKNLLLSPNPEAGNVDEKVGATLTDVAAEMADRVILYFNKDVNIANYSKVDADGKATSEIDSTKLDVKIENNVDNKNTTVEDTDAVINPIGLKEVPGNKKAVYAILPTNKTLTDNARLNIRVKDKTGTLATDSTKTTVLTDARRPAMLGVSRDGLNKIVVTFSEPVVNGGDLCSAEKLTNWVVDGVKLDQEKWGKTDTKAEVGTFDVAKGTDSRHIVTITLGKDSSGKQIYLTPGTHSVQGANIGDWANMTDAPNNVINTQTLDLEVPTDNDVPTAKVEVQSPEQYVVTFDKQITEGLTNLQTVLELQKYDVATKEWKKETKQQIQVRAVAETTNKFVVETMKDWTEVYDTETSKQNYYNDNYRLAIPEGKITSASNGKTNSKIELLLEGAMKTADVTSPSIDLIKELTQGTKYSVTMSEPVKFPVGGDGLVTKAQKQLEIPTPTAQFIKKDASKTVNGTVVAGTDAYNKELTVTPNSTLEAGEWTLVVRSISDDIGNTAASAVKDFTVKGETVIGKDFRVTWAGADSDNNYSNGLTEIASANGKDAIFIKFSQPVKTTGGYVSALTTTNYTLNGDPLPKGTQIVSNISGYDEKDAYTDSVTIILPDGTLTKSIDSTVITVSPYIQNADGKALANGGQFKLSYNCGPTATKAVTTVDEFKKALADDSIRKITSSVDLSAVDVTVSRLVDIDFGTQNVKSLNVSTTDGGVMNVTNGTVAGTLTVNTPNADFVVGAGTIVNGTTTIKDVLSNTFTNKGTLKDVVIEDANGSGFTNENVISGKVTIDTTGAVNLGGNITNVEVKKPAKLEIKGTVANLNLKEDAKGVTVAVANGATVTTVVNNTNETVKVGDKEVKANVAPTISNLVVNGKAVTITNGVIDLKEATENGTKAVTSSTVTLSEDAKATVTISGNTTTKDVKTTDTFTTLVADGNLAPATVSALDGVTVTLTDADGNATNYTLDTK